MNLDPLLDRLRHHRAAEVATGTAAGAFDSLDAHHYLLLVSFRADGSGVPTPLWFAPGAECLYASTSPGSAKVRRIRRNGQVRIAPCSARGKPLGPAIVATAQLATSEQARAAEVALAARYGRLRRLYRRFAASEDRAYLLIRPSV